MEFKKASNSSFIIHRNGIHGTDPSNKRSHLDEIITNRDITTRQRWSVCND